MECQAKLEWREDKKLSCYQSYTVHLRDVQGEEWQLMVVCESKAAGIVRVAVRRGVLRRLVSDHVTQGRASVLFSDQEKDLSAIDIKNAPPNRLRVFVQRLNSLLSSPSPSSASPSAASHCSPVCGIKRKINIGGRNHQSYGAKMLAASLAAQQTTPGNTKSFYKDSLQSPSGPAPHHSSPSPIHYRSPSNHPPAAKRPLLLEPTSTPKRLIMSDESSSVRRPALKELSHNQSASSTATASQGSSMRGFTNLGNTCYMNAVLQSLLSLQPFTADLMNNRLVKIVHQDSLYRWLYLLVKYKESNDSITSQHICLNKIRRALSASANTFASYNEQDAHELLNHCMDQLRIDVTSSSDTAVCPVENNFKSVIRHTISCTRCTHSVTSSETVYDYTLQLPQWVAMSNAQQASLQQLIEDYFNSEQVDYTCTQCQCSSSSISHKLVQLPRILVLTLKRYNNHSKEKRVDAVRIPRHLLLSPLCSTITVPPPEYSRLETVAATSTTISPAIKTQTGPVEHKDVLNLSEEEQLQLALEMSLNDSLQCNEDVTADPPSPQLSSSQEEQEHTYRLASVISHVGKGTSTGHYVSDVATEAGNWLSYNDSVVTPTSEEKVRQSRKMSGYIFFYLHRNTLYQKSS